MAPNSLLQHHKLRLHTSKKPPWWTSQAGRVTSHSGGGDFPLVVLWYSVQPKFFLWGSLFFPSAAWALHQWAILLLPEVTRLLFPPSEKCMSSSHCLLASVALFLAIAWRFCLERSCLSLFSHPNAIKHTCLFLQLLTCCWGTKKEQNPQQEGHSQESAQRLSQHCWWQQRQGLCPVSSHHRLGVV